MPRISVEIRAENGLKGVRKVPGAKEGAIGFPGDRRGAKNEEE